MIEKIKELADFSKTIKVLYVEDNVDARESTLNMLENLFNDITIAIDGQDGLDKFSEGKFDLIISDINMPNMNGIEMISKWNMKYTIRTKRFANGLINTL